MEGARLLVIDDSPTIRKLIELTFRGTEWTVTFASSAGEGIASAMASPPDLIALDYVLPDLRGIDVCARLASEPATRGIPIVVVSAKSDEVRHQFESYPAVMACLPKPFTAEQFRKVAAAVAANLAPSAGTQRASFTREQRERAAQTIFGRLRSALGNVPRWASEIGAAPPATFYARKLLTQERVDAILEGLLPLYREVVAATNAPGAPSVDSSSAAMSGELRAWPIGELLNFFAASGRVGELRLVHGERTLLTYWRRGEIILVTTLDPDEYLRGVPLGRLAPDALARAKAEQRATGRPAFVTLAEEGAALPSSLGDLLHRQGRRLLLDAIDSKVATFAWRDVAALPLYVDAHGRHISTARNTLVLGATSPDAPQVPAASLEQLALERLRREPGSAPFSDDAVFDRVRGFTDRIRRFELDANERRVLAAINGVNAVADIAARVSLPVDQVRLVLARLADVDLVTERELADADVARPVFILEPDVDGFQRPLEALLRSRAVESPVVSLADERDIVGAIRREHPRLVILNASIAGGSLAETARAVRATGGLAHVSLVAVLESDRACDADALRAAGFDAVFVKPVPYADLERLIA